MKNNNQKIYESPDSLRDINGTYLDYFEDDAIVFGWYKNVLYTSDEPAATHGGALVDAIPADIRKTSYISRNKFEYPGRLWCDSKIISFWDMPEDDEVYNVISEISNKLDLNIIGTGEWYINFYGGVYNGWQTKPLSDYESSVPVPQEELDADHNMTPLLKKRKSVPVGVGSKHKQTKPLDYKQAMSNENVENEFYPKLFENPDVVIIDYDNDHKDLHYHDGNMGSITFGWYDDKLYTNKAKYPFDIKNTHTNMAEDHNLIHKGNKDTKGGYYIERSDWEYPGRLWTEAKVISFWKFPLKEDMLKVLEGLSKELNITFDDEWKIDIFTRSFPVLKKEDFSNKRDFRRARNKQAAMLDDEELWKLIPLKDYIGAGILPKSLIDSPHNLSPVQKTQSNVPIGIGSKHKNSKPLDYRLAMTSESLHYDYFDNFLLEKLLVGEPVTIPELRDILNKKVLNFEFIKLNGDVRPAKGTTMMKYIPKEDQPSGLNSPSSDKVAAFYDLSKDAWRSVSNRSKEVVIDTDEKGKPKIVISDKKPKEDKVAKPPVVDGKPSPKPLVDPVEPVIKPTIVPDEVPETPTLKGDEFDDKKKALDTTDPNIVADEIDDEDIIVADGDEDGDDVFDNPDSLDYLDDLESEDEDEDEDEYQDVQTELVLPSEEDEDDEDDEEDEEEIIDIM